MARLPSSWLAVRGGLTMASRRAVAATERRGRRASHKPLSGWAAAYRAPSGPAAAVSNREGCLGPRALVLSLSPSLCSRAEPRSGQRMLTGRRRCTVRLRGSILRPCRRSSRRARRSSRDARCFSPQRCLRQVVAATRAPRLCFWQRARRRRPSLTRRVRRRGSSQPQMGSRPSSRCCSDCSHRCEHGDACLSATGRNCAEQGDSTYKVAEAESALTGLSRARARARRLAKSVG